jgi:hypothetical protein
MRSYDDWLNEFIAGKTEVPTLEHSDSFSVHSIRRFLEGEFKVWEIAITYTERLVVRSGEISDDGITIKWNHWVTLHEVRVSKSKNA